MTFDAGAALGGAAQAIGTAYAGAQQAAASRRASKETKRKTISDYRTQFRQGQAELAAKQADVLQNVAAGFRQALIGR